jgi:hypothetical protein
MAMSNRFLASLGMVMVNFQALEIFAEFFIWGLISDDQTLGKIITATRVSFEAKLDLLTHLFNHRTSDTVLREELQEIVTSASEASKTRNSLMHSVYLTSDLDEEEDVITRFKITARRNQGLVHQTEDVGLPNIHVSSSQIEGVAKKLIGFMNKCSEKGILSIPTKLV